MTGVEYYGIKYDRGWDIMKSNMTEFGSIMTSNMMGWGFMKSNTTGVGDIIKSH